MYVCLCTGTTSQAVREAVAGGASTCRQVAAACGAGTDCGRCWRSVREIIESHFETSRQSAGAGAPRSAGCRVHPLREGTAVAS